MEKLTQSYLAGKTQFSQAFISQLTNGQRRPSWRSAKLLAESSNTKPELWLEGSPEDIQSIFGAEIENV